MSEDTLYINRQDVQDELGIGWRCLDQMVEVGAIRRVVLPGCTKGKYIRADVQRLLEEHLAPNPNFEQKIQQLHSIEVIK